MPNSNNDFIGYDYCLIDISVKRVECEKEYRINPTRGNDSQDRHTYLKFMVVCFHVLISKTQTNEKSNLFFDHIVCDSFLISL